MPPPLPVAQTIANQLVYAVPFLGATVLYTRLAASREMRNHPSKMESDAIQAFTYTISNVALSCLSILAAYMSGLWLLGGCGVLYGAANAFVGFAIFHGLVGNIERTLNRRPAQDVI